MQQNCQITRCARQHTMDSALKSAKLRRDLTGNRNGFTHARPAPVWPRFTKVGWASRWQIRESHFKQLRFRHFRHNRNTKLDSDRCSYRPVNCICTRKYTVYRGSCRFSADVEASVTWHTGFSQWRPLFVDSRRQIGRSQNRSRMCEIRLTKLSCAAQQVGIVHFYAVTEIKGFVMSPVMNARVEKFAHINTCGLSVCHTGSREWRVTKIWGPRCKRD